MKKTNNHPKSAGSLLMVLAFLVLSSCQKDLFVKKDVLSGLPQNVSEAASWYKNQVIPLTGDTIFSAQNNPEWEKTKVVKQKNYSTFTVPVYTNGKISRELTINGSESGYTGTVKEYDRSRKDQTLIYTYTINGRLIERGILMSNGTYRHLGTPSNFNGDTGNGKTVKAMGSEGSTGGGGSIFWDQAVSFDQIDETESVIKNPAKIRFNGILHCSAFLGSGTPVAIVESVDMSMVMVNGSSTAYWADGTEDTWYTTLPTKIYSHSATGLPTISLTWSGSKLTRHTITHPGQSPQSTLSSKPISVTQIRSAYLP